MSLTTRRPTGRAPWPIVLLAGREKAGKSWAALAASASPLVGRTLYIGIGEDDPDEYSLIPGADFEIVEHDGTYTGVLAAVRDAVAEPSEGAPNLIVLDSATRLWNLISDNAQGIANRKARGQKNPLTADHSITPDLWNAAAGQWGNVMDALRRHQGPVIVTARLDLVMVMENGTPTNRKEWKVQGHKSLPFDVSAVVEMHERGSFLLTGVRSARIALPRPREVPEFTIEWLWETLGVADGTGERTHATVVSDADTPKPVRTQRERVAAVLEAINTAPDVASLDAVWRKVQDSKLDDVPELIAAFDARAKWTPEEAKA